MPFQELPEGETVSELTERFVRDVCSIDSESASTRDVLMKSQVRARLKEIIEAALMKEQVRLREKWEEEMLKFQQGFAYRPKK